ncbi:MAG: hypothetical protein K0Q73_6076 [Paenibacillus sp.]|nr:hypothetical protein [Paenibacillus sp.]
MTSKLEILKQTSFGERVAEDDDKLASYFVETEIWKKLVSGEVDIIKGVKGSGKSALYMHLLGQIDSFTGRNIILIPAENIKGATVFRSVLGNAELTETSFQYLWSIYIITLIGDQIKIFSDQHEQVNELVKKLEAEGLLEGRGIRRLLSNVRDYVASFFKKVGSVEGGATIDPATGIPMLTGKISLNEPTAELRKQGVVSVDELYEMANEVLQIIGIKVWITFDRLDVAFSENIELETLALRTLFQVYNNLKQHQNIRLKIFIRDDIWRRISEGGFREASHIVKQVTIDWSEQDFMHLLASRIMDNAAVVDYVDMSKEKVLADKEEQTRVFYKLFPDKVEVGRNPDTFKWMLSRVKDGLGISAPRELIHLMNESKNKQIKSLETGTREDSYPNLISRTALKEALKVVSRVRIDQTIYAEHSHLKPYIERLEEQKTEQDIDTLSKIFETDKKDTVQIANELVAIGFFEEKKDSEKPYWTPFLYRGGLSMVQGKEEA